MKHCFVLLLAVIFMVGVVGAAEPHKFDKVGNDRFSIKVEPFIGAYLMQSGNMKDIDPNPPSAPIILRAIFLRPYFFNRNYQCHISISFL